LAEQTIIYTAIFSDNLARTIAMALNYRSDEIDSIGMLRGHKQAAALLPVRNLIEELDIDGNWWHLACREGVGARQRIIHNNHFIRVGSRGPFQGPPYGLEVMLARWPPDREEAEYFSLMRSVYASLFDWCERLDVVLTTQVEARGIALPEA